MEIGFGGEAGSQIEKLTDPHICQMAHRPSHPRAVGSRAIDGLRYSPDYFLGCNSVDMVMVLPAEKVVVHPCRVRPIGAHLRNGPADLAASPAPQMARHCGRPVRFRRVRTHNGRYSPGSGFVRTVSHEKWLHVVQRHGMHGGVGGPGQPKYPAVTGAALSRKEEQQVASHEAQLNDEAQVAHRV
ncbi:hypothetical protein GCM10010390_05650 [Streptomyces mordarskii]|uniref:Uncharacterized protein n=1 Tax=Streptomyces mordarskii TaxID=1226758 RepID=A0ABP3LRH7_9ACTN